MPVQSLTVIPYTPQPHVAASAAPLGRREKLKLELRTAFNTALEELTGIPGVHMWYTLGKYANFVVGRYGQKLVNWPEEIVFDEISNIKGGNRALAKLLDLWKSGTLRFEPATERDIWNARNDPARVHPNPSGLHDARRKRQSHGDESGSESVRDSGFEGDDEGDGGQGCELDVEAHEASLHGQSVQPDTLDTRLAAAEASALVVRSLVFHPGTMEPLGSHYTSTRPSAAAALLGKRPRQQRSDIKKPRYRTANDAQRRGSRRPRKGVQSARYTLESGKGVFGPGQDVERERASEPRLSESEPAAKHRKVQPEYWLTDDPLEEFRDTPLYETVDPSWLSASSSALADVDVELESDIETAWGCSDSDANAAVPSSEPDEIEVESEGELGIVCSGDVESISGSEGSGGEDSESDIDDADSS